MADTRTQGGIAKLQIVSAVGTVNCQFNPSSFSFQKQNTWKDPQGKGIADAPKLKFVSGGSAAITLDLTLDTTDTGNSVVAETDKLMKLMKVDAGANPKAPPTCHLLWGSYKSFEAVVEAIDLKYTYFASNGTPLRAQVKLALKQAHDDEKAFQNPTSHTPRPHRVHIALPGETLDRIAWRYYGSSARWRRLAEANGIIDPLALAAGQALIIPDAGEGPRAR